jgi:hypothetical protein
MSHKEKRIINIAMKNGFFMSQSYGKARKEGGAG